MAGSGFKFQGIENVDALLDALGKKLGTKVMSQILRKNAQPMLSAAKRLVPKDEGATKGSIGLIEGKGAKRGRVVYLGPRRSRGGAAAHLVEYGTGPRTRKNGGSTGSMPAKPFMRPAFTSQVAGVVQGIKSDIQAVLDGNFSAVNFDTGKLDFSAIRRTGLVEGERLKSISTGSRNGRFYYAASGRKVYIKRKK